MREKKKKILWIVCCVFDRWRCDWWATTIQIRSSKTSNFWNHEEIADSPPNFYDFVEGREITGTLRLGAVRRVWSQIGYDPSQSHNIFPRMKNCLRPRTYLFPKVGKARLKWRRNSCTNNPCYHYAGEGQTVNKLLISKPNDNPISLAKNTTEYLW